MQNSKCTVTRTHRLGVPLSPKERSERVPGPIAFAGGYHRGLHRGVERLCIERLTAGGLDGGRPIPDLMEPKLLTYHSERAMMFCGWEEIEGRRYYQGWWIQWVGW